MPTIAEKILARASGKEKVSPGDFVTAKVDKLIIMQQFPYVHENLCKAGFEGGVEVRDLDRVYVMLEHFFPPPNADLSRVYSEARKLVKMYKIKNYCEVQGIYNQIAPESGLIKPGELVVATDSHAVSFGAFNCAGTAVGEAEAGYIMATGEMWFQVPGSIKFILTGKFKDRVTVKDLMLHIAKEYTTEVALYKSIEWQGSLINRLSMDSRMTISALSLELGAKFSIFPADEILIEYMKGRIQEPFTPVSPDEDASYEETYSIDVGVIEPLVALPHGWREIKHVSEVEGIPVDEVRIGSCAHGRYEDLKAAADILRGKKVHPDTRLIVEPASWEQYFKAWDAGLIKIFVNAGAHILEPGCGVCMAHRAFLGEGEVCLAATTRNFQGRFGSPKAKIYLASPTTAAASALKGCITDPRKVL
jgi:homoaconitate hydratase family protein